jgi:hypothetical protein
VQLEISRHSSGLSAGVGASWHGLPGETDAARATRAGVPLMRNEAVIRIVSAMTKSLASSTSTRAARNQYRIKHARKIPKKAQHCANKIDDNGDKCGLSSARLRETP